MKRHLLLIIFIFICVCAKTEIVFTHTLTHTDEKTILVTFKGKVPEGYHISGSVSLDKSKGVKLAGQMKQIGEELFSQRIIITSADYSFAGSFMYVACDDQQCFMPKYVEFKDKGHCKAFDVKTSESTNPRDSIDSSIPSTSSISSISIEANEADTIADKYVTDIASLIPEVKGEVRSELSTTDVAPNDTFSTLLTLFFLGFIGGFAALLTPCVWPIIPLTVGFFMKKRRGVRDALLFGVCIIAMFLALGITVTAAYGAGAMNELSTSAVFNVICFIALLLLGLSMMGFFTIALPSSLANKTDEMAEKSTGVVSILFMALTLVIVSFSCTAPIMGVLLVQVASADSLLAPTVGLTGFAIALALPFTIFALFPSLMKKLRISGKWLQTIKVTLGVLEVAFSLKFLSVADQAYGWDILPRTPFLIIWALLFAYLAYYLFRRLDNKSSSRFSKESSDYRKSRDSITSSINQTTKQQNNKTTKQQNWLRLLALLPALLAIYLVQGIFTHETSFVSAFIPIDKTEEKGKFSTNDFYEGLRLAKEHNRRIFLDFTGYGCVNCRKMEGSVFVDPRVRTILEEEFVVVHLYVDDRTPLPEILTVTIDGKETKLRTVGDRWSLFERQRFGAQSQPLYVILSPDSEILSPTYGYDEDIEQFLAFLNSTK